MRHKLAQSLGFLFVIAALGAFSPAVYAQKANMLEIEQRLSQLGYWITKVDGKADASTRQAILAFQKVEHRKRTGVVSAADMEAADVSALAIGDLVFVTNSDMTSIYQFQSGAPIGSDHSVAGDATKRFRQTGGA